MQQIITKEYKARLGGEDDKLIIVQKMKFDHSAKWNMQKSELVL